MDVRRVIERNVTTIRNKCESGETVSTSSSSSNLLYEKRNFQSLKMRNRARVSRVLCRLSTARSLEDGH